MKKTLVCLFALSTVLACKDGNDRSKETEANNLSETASKDTVKENDENWQYLFDGENAEGWRAYNGEEGEGLPSGWVVEDGTLKSLGKGGDIGGDIVYEKEEFGEFELSMDWKISEGGNSGVFYHVVEDEKYASPYFTAPEYQMIDQKGFPDKLEPWQSIGADYGMYDPEYEDEDLKPVGEWNNTRIKFTKDKVTYWLNGKRLWSSSRGPMTGKRKNEGKWKEFPDYGSAREGLIGLQDHGSLIWFKDIKIRKL